MIRERQREGITRPRRQSDYRARKKSLADSEIADFRLQTDGADDRLKSAGTAPKFGSTLEQLVGNTRRPWLRVTRGILHLIFATEPWRTRGCSDRSRIASA